MIAFLNCVSNNGAMKKKGKITPNGVVLKNHENATVVFLTELGYNVELVPVSRIKGIHTPDIKMNGADWEIKIPIGGGNQLMKNTVQKALKQSRNVIIDLRHTRRHQAKCVRELEREFEKSKQIKQLKVILKNSTVLDYKK